MYNTAPESDIAGGHVRASRVFAALGWEWRGRKRADVITDALIAAGLLETGTVEEPDAGTRKRVGDVFVVPADAGIAWVQRQDTP